MAAAVVLSPESFKVLPSEDNLPKQIQSDAEDEATGEETASLPTGVDTPAEDDTSSVNFEEDSGFNDEPVKLIEEENG